MKSSNYSSNHGHFAILGLTDDQKFIPLPKPKISIKIDHRRVLEVPGDHNETISYATHLFIQIAQNAIKERGKFFVALSGGSTPKEIYSHLTTDKYKRFIDWKKVYLFWSDERAVEPTHPDSNYKMAMDCGFKHVGIPANQIFRMEAESDIDQHSLMYQECIGSTLQGSVFDLIMLGVGEDGHTASLFPATEALDQKSRHVVANYVPQQQAWRMTMTIPFINQADNVIVYAIGEKKKDIIKKVLLAEKTPEPLPAERIGSSSHPALWLADDKAAQAVLKALKK
ncbi:MAG: 6-phosphogluconolactonase [Chlamydiales bacterium]|nr:6-phosphogluconolactonase [Chlamydiales bacterium]